MVFGFLSCGKLSGFNYYVIILIKINVDNENGYARIELGSDQSTR